MYKELVKRNIIILTIALTLVFLLSLFVTTSVNRNNLKKEVVVMSEVVLTDLKGLNQDEIESKVYSLTDDWYSVIIADNTGKVIIDSTSDSIGEGVGEDNLTESEIKRADDEKSDKVYIANSYICYVCKFDDYYFKAMVKMADETEYIIITIFFFGVLLIGVLTLSIIFTNNTSKKVALAFDNISNHLKTLSMGSYTEIDLKDTYPEVQSAYLEINAVNKSIVAYIQKISEEKNKLDFIMNNIGEGIIILDDDGIIKIANEKAKCFLQENYENRNIVSVVADKKLASVIANGINGGIGADYHDKNSDNIYFVQVNKFSASIEYGSLYSVILQDVTESRRQENIKADFIANASHELKTPITSISGFSELILSGLVKDKDKLFEYIGKIFNESVHMKNTIDKLLYLSKLDSVGGEIIKELIDLEELTDQVIDKLTEKASKKNISLIREGGGYIEGDVGLIEHMMSNLVDNAIKYNVEGGKVTIKIKSINDKTVLSVEDTGIGMEEKHLSKLFERFYRADESRTKLTGGTGLGLTIVKKICDLHSATIGVESKPQVGTKFIITFN